MNAPQYLSRGIDYLGDLGAKLRDLQGHKTLAYELIQNADDVPDATAMAFDVCDHALIVENNGLFSDCGQIELPECPWKDVSERGHRCDFHRFRHVAAGDKRAQEGTTGAFGIGFIAAYQITDQPELISVGRHWILHEERPENERVEVCSGCAKCNDNSLPSTRFILPWAKDPESFLRKALSAQPVSESDIEMLFNELNHSLPASMLFLKHLRKIELKCNGQQHRLFQRLDVGDSLILTDGNTANDKVWHILDGDFSREADVLRAKHPGRIEDKRSSRVTVAIPEEDVHDGLLCAYLPTEQETGLPFYINADFFPTSDRKRLILATDYQSEWNRAALGGAANALASRLGRLPECLGHQRFWSLLDRVKKVSDAVNNTGKEPSFGAFWELVSPRLRTERTIYTTTGEWITPGDCFLLSQSEEREAIPLLEKLGLKIVSEDLRSYQNLLRSEVVGVSPLGIPVLCDALSAIGLDRPVEEPERLSVFADKTGLQTLWAEIALLRNRERRTFNVRSEHEIRLKAMAIAPVLGGSLFQCEKAYWAESPTVELFDPICPALSFLSDNPDFEPLQDLCPVFDAGAAIEALDMLGSTEITSAWESKRLNLKQLFSWFENRRHEILGDPLVKQQLANLAIFPSTFRLKSLGELVLPGNFNDYLGLAEMVDVEALGGRREFLRDLGMQALDFKTYALRLPAFLKSSDIEDENRRRAVALLAERIGEIRDDAEVQNGLAVTRLVECNDGAFHEASACYFENDIVKACLGDSVLTAVVSGPQSESLQSLYEWLGVVAEPRISELIQRVEWLANCPYSLDLVQIVVTIVAYLGKRCRSLDSHEEFQELSSLAWLPARDKTDRWYRPDELYAAYRDYLFDTQAEFLDVPMAIQNDSSALFGLLGLNVEPDASLVVKHLLHCSNLGIPVHQEIYRFLNDNSDDPAILELRTEKCLCLKEEYAAPSQVFWGEHPFGIFRHKLGEELRIYGNFFKRLGVRDGPDHTDALAVLKEIAASFEEYKKPLEQETQAVLMACWRLLEAALDEDGRLDGQAAETLEDLKCVQNAHGMLNPPGWMFFENRAGLAEKFGAFLSGNVIPRPMGAAKAMMAAGVRHLGAAVKVQLLECDDANADLEIAERVRSRRNGLGRILDAQGLGYDIANVLERLNGIRFEGARSLVIQYQLSAFNRIEKSDPESTPALYLVEEDRLIFTRRNGNLAWPALARELAIALLPDEDPGKIAAGIKEVLAADSLSQSAQILDELGYPKLETEVAEAYEDNESVTALGTGETINDAFSPSESGEKAASCANRGLTAAEPDEAVLGERFPKPTLPPPVTEVESPSVSGSYKRQQRKGDKAKKKRPVLRSYLPPPETDTTALDESEQGDHEVPRSPVDEAGVRRVLDYERDCGRNPKEMPHHNPGYDIESRDPDGKILRYIEVKSLSGLWTNGFAALSRPQFDKASRLGDTFWLYVVDQAETDGFRIYRIQNPAQRANQFMFDDGWQAVAESDEISERHAEWSQSSINKIAFDAE